MKQITLLLFICIHLVAPVQYSLAQAQQAPDDKKPKNGNNVKTGEILMVAYLTRQLNLTSDEAQKFWPIYYAYLDELKRTRKESKEKNIGPLEMEEKVLNIRKKYKESFKKVLITDQRTDKLFVAERNFGNIVRREWQNRLEHTMGPKQ